MTQQPPPYPGEIGPDQQPPLPPYGQQPPPQPYPQPQYGQPQYELLFPPKPGQFHPRRLHNLSGLATAASVLAIVYALMLVALAVLAFPAEGALIDDYDAYTVYDSVEYASWALGVATYVVACLWLYNARQNAEMLRPDIRHSLPTGWVWGGWVVPIVNFWFPFQIVRDVVAERNDSRSSPLVNWWWGTFLAACLLSNVCDIFSYGTSAFAEFATAAAVVSLAALALWLMLIREITAKRSTPQA